MLTKEEQERYTRQIILHGFGKAGQEKLKKAKVFLAGAGGLGSPVAIYLAVAGIGSLRIADHDKVELSNLNRQILQWQADIGKNKVKSAAEKLHEFNPNTKIETTSETINEKNVLKLIGDSDVIVDAMDNLPTRYVLNRAAVEKKIPLFHGAVYGFEGRALTVLPGKSACLNCLFHGVKMPAEKFPVIGVTPGIIGCIQATEVIKYITGQGELLTNRLLTYDGLQMKFSEFKINRDPYCEVCGGKRKR